jgi:diguanylate cyclase (GGDEF)-like protein/PAS domain S-box-containing protein
MEQPDGAWLDADDGTRAGREIDASMQQLLAQVIIQSPALVAIVDDKLDMVFCNEAFRAFGWQPEEVVGRSALEYLHPDDLDRAGAGMRALGQRADLRSAPYRLLRSDGEYEPFEVLPATFDGPDGRVFFSFTLMSNPFMRAQTMALTAIASGVPPEHSLDVLAQEFSRNRPGAVVAFDGAVVEGTVHDRVVAEPWRVTVGSAPAVLAGVVDGVQDLTPGAPWTRAIETGDIVTITGLDGLPEFVRREAERLGLQAAVFVAADDPGRARRGLIASWTRNPETFDILEVNVMAMSTIVNLALERRAHQEALERLAHHDPLTGLANRARFFSQLDLAIDRPGPPAGAGGDGDDLGSLSVVYLDLDDFKPVNDRHGHQAGDEVLAEIGRRFTAVVRGNDVVARLGGDEFGVLLSGPSSSSQGAVDEIVRRLLAVAGEPFVFGELTATIGATAGVVFVRRPAGLAADALVGLADDALYRAKRERKGSFEITTI